MKYNNKKIINNSSKISNYDKRSYSKPHKIIKVNQIKKK